MEQTIEERATMYGLSATKHLSDSLRPQAIQRMHDVYKAIATEQKRIDIDKACEWLKEHAMYYGYASGIDATYAYDADMLVKNFRKAMEKQD